MIKKILLFSICLMVSVGLFPFQASPQASWDVAGDSAKPERAKFFIDKDDWAFYTGAHLRTSYNLVNNTVSLDYTDHADENYYLGYAYDFTLDLRHISGFEFYAFIERRGRADYDAPFDGNKSIDTLFGRYEWYRNSDMWPCVREYWLEMPLTPSQEINLKVGQFPYGREVGHKIALGGKYENYGATLSGMSEKFDWNLHWEIEDYNNRIFLGKRPNFDQEINKYDTTSAHFSACDAVLKAGEQRIQGYLGWLHDSTSDTDRGNKFVTPVKEENLITAGAYLDFSLDKLKVGLEGAKNFGAAQSTDCKHEDVEHKGYLLVGDASYDMGSFKPKCKAFLASGNKLDPNDYGSTRIPGNENNAFSVFSPLNTHITDSHYQKQFGPYVAMAGGYAVNFGVARPGTYGDPFLFENIIAYTIGFDYTPIDKVYVGIDYWWLRSKEAGYGLDQTGALREFPKDLGQEVDFFLSYNFTQDIKFSILGGYFLPGKYYEQERSDSSLSNKFTSTARRDGEADGAYQLELGLDITF